MAYRAPPSFSPAASARLDGLKLVLIAQVILGHVANLAYPTVAQIKTHGLPDLFVLAWRMVTRFGIQSAVVFICISGFFLAPRLLDIALGRDGAQPIGAFLQARLRRIYPTLVFAVALTVVCDLVGQHLPGGDVIYHRGVNYDYVERLNWHTVLGNLLSLQPTFSDLVGSNGPLWTLGYIVQFYVAGAALAGAFRADRRLGFAVLAGLFIAALMIKLEWGILFACWLGCGMMRWFQARTAMAGLVALAVGAALMVLANLAAGRDLLLVWEVSAGLAGAAFLFAMPAPFGSWMPDRLPAVLVKVSNASYPIYALHHPLLVLTFTALVPHFAPGSLLFRAGLPVVVLVVVLAVSFAWQAVLDRLVPAKK